ncbi:TMEM165/GDT1 family protein [Pseudidiomarina sp. 1APP75-32.1]|uniref:GDT1 family protein n=1 Tax=Pseudidiomarina terrestris TaxID=2820060 RepID=A0AAW7R0G9_9GAMM|nr:MULTISPECIES: TMEM165/GDT1 family protein [unclassified Pseudidiomarina]MDN7124778.1 TMEM165/GDT1 family protein [Pseudidiomarina sp. 1APP75-32.1]MDN7129748.1 TMEM165/GDT1 family protein [Pseudidiomarina sp. 1APR75-15]
MEAFLTSTLTVALAEIGDKTQLLSLVLVARYRQKWPIIIGIITATLINHFVSAWFGQWSVSWLPADYAGIVIAISFIAIGLWVLVPDKLADEETRCSCYGALCATFVLFSLAEIGDKTQIATVVLGAQYASVVWVTLGTTLGMLIANVPVVLLGGKLMRRVPLDTMRYVAAAVFVLLGLATLWWNL